MLEVLNQSFRSFLDQGDARVKNWPMMQTPFPGVAMIAAYVYFVKVAGPQFMKKREPYQLRTPMVIYNFLLVLLNLWVFLGIGWYGYFNGYSLKCQPVDYSNAHSAVRMAQMGYLFYILKFVEFADTIFFVLRKKYNQISALHVIHHSIVPFSLWFGIKFAPGGYNAFFPFLNSFVHVVMYTYYGLAALGDKYKKYLFWKKYMTYIQLAQFVGVIIYAISLYWNNCNISTTFIFMNFIHALLFFGLFLNFFIQSYIKMSSTRSNPSLASSEKARLCNKAHEMPKVDHNSMSSKGKTTRNSYVRHRAISCGQNDLLFIQQYNNSTVDDNCSNSSVKTMMTIGNFCALNNNSNRNSTPRNNTTDQKLKST